MAIIGDEVFGLIRELKIVLAQTASLQAVLLAATGSSRTEKKGLHCGFKIQMFDKHSPDQLQIGNFGIKTTE